MVDFVRPRAQRGVPQPAVQQAGGTFVRPRRLQGAAFPDPANLRLLAQGQEPVVPAAAPAPGEIPTVGGPDIISQPRGETPGGLQNVPILGEALSGLASITSSVNRGLVNLADLPANLSNLVLGTAGSDIRAPRIAEIPAVERATRSPIPEEERGFIPRTLELGAEFFGGGAPITQGARLAATAPARAGQQLASVPTTGRFAAQELARTPLATEVKVGFGAATAGELVGDENPLLRLGAEITGGGLVGLSSRPGGLVAPAERRAAAILRSEAADIKKARANLEKEALGLPVERTDDVGIMRLLQKIMLEDASVEQRFSGAVQESNKVIADEIESILSGQLGANQNVAAQNFLARNKELLLSTIDDRLAQVEQQIIDIGKLGAGTVDDVAISKQLDEAIDVARQDVDEQATALWGLVDQGDYQINTGPLVDAAREVVAQAGKFKDIPVKHLEKIIGRKIQLTSDGWVVTTRPTRIRTYNEEPMQVMTSASSFYKSEARRTAAGKDVNASLNSIWNRLTTASIQAIEATPGAGPAYEAARDFTRKSHDVFTRGRIGATQVKDVTGQTVTPEETGRTLLGADRFGTAAGARNLAELEALSGSAATRQPSADFLLARFRREAQKGPKQAEQFLEDHQTTLGRFPEVEQTVRQTVRDLNQRAGRQTQLESRKRFIEKDKFLQLADMSTKRAIRAVSNSREPVKVANKLWARIRRDPDAATGWKRAVADHAIERMFSAGQLGFKSVDNVLKELKPLLNSNMYTTAERNSLVRALKTLRRRAELLREKPSRVPLRPNILVDLLGRFTGAKIASAATKGGSSIILAGAGARAGRQIFNKIPEAAAREIMIESLFDEKLFKRLLDLDITAAQAPQTLISLIAPVNAELAAELQEAFAEQ